VSKNGGGKILRQKLLQQRLCAFRQRKMNANETFGFQLWFQEREVIFAVVGVLFFLSVVIVFACACLCTIVFACCTNCGQGHKTALEKKERLVQWKKEEEDKGVTISPESIKLDNWLDPSKETWRK
jgi:hypothetical protein